MTAPASTRSSTPAGDPLAGLAAVHGRLVEEERELALLAVELFDVEHVARTAGLAPDAFREALEELLGSLPGSGRRHLARRGARLVVLLEDAGLRDAEELGKALVAAARELPVGGRAYRGHPCIGLACPPGSGDHHFETLVRVAEEGASVAGFRGGGCTVHTMLYDTLEEQVRREAAEPGASFAPPPVRGARSAEVRALVPAARAASPEHPGPGPTSGSEAPAPALEERLRRLVEDELRRELDAPTAPDTPSNPPSTPPSITEEERLAALTGAVTARALEALRRELADAPAAPGSDPAELSRLRRRVDKLVRTLEDTERRLLAAEERRTEDTGVASAFRHVQGLPETEADYELKRDLLRAILDANLELQVALAAQRRAQVSA